MPHVDKPDPELCPHQRDKRSAISIADRHVDARAIGSTEENLGLLKLAAVEDFEAKAGV